MALDRALRDVALWDREAPFAHREPPEECVAQSASLAIATDVQLHGFAIEQAAAAHPGLTFLGCIYPSSGCVRRIASMRPDVLILDLGASRNLMLAREVSNDAPSTRLLTISSDCVQRAPIYVEAGVTGFLSADANNTDLVRAVLVVAGGGVWCSARVAASLANALRRATNAGDQLLSRREQQIMELLQLGLSNRQIAEHLTLGLSTVKNHVHNILEKLKVTSRGEAVELWSGLDAGAYNRS